MRLRRDVLFTERNQITLLNGGNEFFPVLINAINRARSEIRLETYLFSRDLIGQSVHDALCRAAHRQVKVYVIIDWLGTRDPRSTELARSFAAAGVYFRCFNPWFKRGFARTHRKLFVADKKLAIVGGININHDLFAEGENKRTLQFPRWDFAASVTGPLVAEIHQLMSEQWQKSGKLDWRQRFEILTKKRVVTRPPTAPVVAGLAPRDNFLYRRTLHRAYLHALRNARQSVLIATPYFAPGHKFFNAIINAAKRGVNVTLLIGCGEFQFQDAVTHFHYPKLLKYGVHIIEYQKSPLHAKVAVVDNEWSTIGSCNCDGLSLFVNHEANLLIRNLAFCTQLSAAILQGVADGVRINPADYESLSWQKKCWYGCAFLIYSFIMRVIAVEDFM